MTLKKTHMPGVLSQYSLKAPLEVFTRTKIEDRLRSLGYSMDESIPSTCNIYRERAKYEH